MSPCFSRRPGVPLINPNHFRIKKLLRTLKDEHRKRTSYVLYLQQSRLTLLRLLSQINKLSQRVEK